MQKHNKRTDIMYEFFNLFFILRDQATQNLFTDVFASRVKTETVKMHEISV